MKKIYFLIIFTGCFFLYSCNKDKPNPIETPKSFVEITVQPTYNSSNLFLDSNCFDFKWSLKANEIDHTALEDF